MISAGAKHKIFRQKKTASLDRQITVEMKYTA